MFSGPHRLWGHPYIGEAVLQSAMREVETAEGIQASSRHSFKGAVFGRDSLEVGIDVVDFDPELVQRILLSVARHIGVQTNPVSEEEPGKHLHEYRSLSLVEDSDPEQLSILRRLSQIWGGTERGFTYFGAFDTGALYLILLERLCSRYGAKFLDCEFQHARSGRSMTIRETVGPTADWYCEKLAHSDIGLVEFLRSNPDGHWFQVMRDGHDGMLDSHGVQADADQPIAAIEIQTVAHAGLKAAARLTGDAGRARSWNQAAEGLRQATFDQLWMRNQNYFARAVGRREDGSPILIDAVDSAAGETLRDDFFDDLTEAEKALYVGSITKRLFGPEFMVDSGIRTLSMQHRSLFDYWTYQGCNTTWPTITKRVADGLHRQGLADLGFELDTRLLNACDRFEGFPEFFFVDDDGQTGYRLTEEPHEHYRTINAASKPMTIQAWTASAALGAFRRTTRGEGDRSEWALPISEEVLEQLWAPYSFSLDLEAGSQSADSFFQEKAGRQPGAHAAATTSDPGAPHR